MLTGSGATVNNIDQVNVTGGSGANSITIDLSGGAFEPGATTEVTGTSDIEFAVDGGALTDTVIIQGGATAEFLDVTGSGGQAQLGR